MSTTWNTDQVLARPDDLDWFLRAQSRLIDELRQARATASEMIALASSPADACFAVGVEAGVVDLLDELGCCEAESAFGADTAQAN